MMGSLIMFVYLFIISLVCAIGVLGLGLVALLRADQKDISKVVRELSGWWHWWH
jgi:hypothetical protein